LCYHNVVGRGSIPQGDASLHLALEEFESQVEWVARHYRVVSLSTLLAESREATSSARPLAAITFDDAYSGVLLNALPALRRRQLPSTIFVTMNASNEPTHYWWDHVASLRPRVDRLALRDQHGGCAAEILEVTGLAATEAPLPAEYLPADWGALRAASDEDLSFGAHTRTHPMLTMQSDSALDAELRGVLTDLESRVGNVVPALAYPYGNVDERVARTASALGYRAAVTTAATLVRGHDSMWLPRLNIPSGMHLAAFKAEASGLRLRGAPQ